MGFSGATRPSAARTRLFKLINTQNGVLRASPPIAEKYYDARTRDLTQAPINVIVRKRIKQRKNYFLHVWESNSSGTHSRRVFYRFGPVEAVDEGEFPVGEKNPGTNKNVPQRMTDRLSDYQSQVGNYYEGQHISLFNHCALFPSHANFTKSFKYIVRLLGNVMPFIQLCH